MSKELEMLGIDAARDPVLKFWECFSERMGALCPGAEECAQKIAKEVMGYGIINVAGMGRMCWNELLQCIVDGGGDKKWMRSVAQYLGMDEYNSAGVVSAQPPPSAALAQISSNTAHTSLTQRTAAKKGGGKQVARFPDVPLGAFLQERGLLSGCVVPHANLMAACQETKNPHIRALTSSDTSRVTGACLAFVADTYGNVGSCKVLFDHIISNQLDGSTEEKRLRGGLFIAPHGARPEETAHEAWYRKLKNKWAVARRPDQGVVIDAETAENSEHLKALAAKGLVVKIETINKGALISNPSFALDEGAAAV